MAIFGVLGVEPEFEGEQCRDPGEQCRLGEGVSSADPNLRFTPADEVALRTSSTGGVTARAARSSVISSSREASKTALNFLVIFCLFIACSKA